MPGRRCAWAGLLCVSREMKLALEVVMRLDGERMRTARVAGLAAAMDASVEETKRVVAGLVRRGIVRNGAAAEGTVSLLARPRDLTLADVASATDEWLTLAPCGEDPDDGIPGLPQALSLVRERVAEGLKDIRLTPFAQMGA